MIHNVSITNSTSVEHLHHRADHAQGHEHELEPHDRHPHSTDLAQALTMNTNSKFLLHITNMTESTSSAIYRTPVSMTTSTATHLTLIPM